MYSNKNENRYDIKRQNMSQYPNNSKSQLQLNYGLNKVLEIKPALDS